jgi:hypothetical protein
MGFSVDKRLKIDKPLGTIYSSHKPHPIKVANTALSDSTKADEIAIKTAKTGKVSVVVAVMSKRCKFRALILEMKSLLAKRQKEQIIRRKIPTNQEVLLKNQEKAGYQRN